MILARQNRLLITINTVSTEVQKVKAGILVAWNMVKENRPHIGEAHECFSYPPPTKLIRYSMSPKLTYYAISISKWSRCPEMITMQLISVTVDDLGRPPKPVATC